MTTFACIFGLSFVCCLLLAPLVRILAKRWGLVDKPDGRRKVHASAIPLGGGLAIFVSAAIAVVAALVASPLRDRLVESQFWLVGLAMASCLICAVGLVDDCRQMRGKYKLFWQLVTVAIVVSCGVQIHSVQFFEWRLELGLLAIPFTMFLLLGAINSLNLIDGMDGLLSSAGLIICLAMGAMAVLAGRYTTACVAFALAGALLGFLRYNFPPASIFMGDCGSMLVGLVVGVLAIQSSLKGPATVALAAPLAVLTLPIFDTSAAILRRKLTGRSLYATDRGHLHHCLLRSGLSTQHVLTWVSMLSLITLVGALASVALNNELLAIFSACTVVGILVATRLFGFAEFVLVKDHLTASAESLLKGRRARKRERLEVHLQGSADWGRLWRELTACAEAEELTAICLDINAPAIQEVYLARWHRGNQEPDDFDAWRAQLPLVVNGHAIGRLEIVGRRTLESTSLIVARLAIILDRLEVVVDSDASAFGVNSLRRMKTAGELHAHVAMASESAAVAVLEQSPFDVNGDPIADESITAQNVDDVLQLSNSPRKPK